MVRIIEARMLLIGRRKNESMVVDDDLLITVADIEPARVQIVISRQSGDRFSSWNPILTQWVEINEIIPLGADGISCVVRKVDDDKVRLGFAPASVELHRKEIYDLLKYGP
jgi:sRNA-binding carbon storage regulator CsrA